MMNNKEFSCFEHSDVFFLQINVKMPTNVGILTFMSRIFSCSFELSMKWFYNLEACFSNYIISALSYRNFSIKLEESSPADRFGTNFVCTPGFTNTQEQSRSGSTGSTRGWWGTRGVSSGTAVL